MAQEFDSDFGYDKTKLTSRVDEKMIIIWFLQTRRRIDWVLLVTKVRGKVVNKIWSDTHCWLAVVSPFFPRFRHFLMTMMPWNLIKTFFHVIPLRYSLVEGCFVLCWELTKVVSLQDVFNKDHNETWHWVTLLLPITSCTEPELNIKNYVCGIPTIPQPLSALRHVLKSAVK